MLNVINSERGGGRLSKDGGWQQAAAVMKRRRLWARVAFQRVRELQTVLRPYAENRIEKQYFLYCIFDVSIFIKNSKNAKNYILYVFKKVLRKNFSISNNNIITRCQ